VIPPLHSLPPRRARAGFTFVELSVVLVILLVALLIFSSTVSGMAKQRTVNRETGLAVNAARNMLESLRSQDFAQVFALYNTDPADDPGGAGSAPGARFAVEGLKEAADAPDDLEGEVQFPVLVVPATGLALREDIEDRGLGMPRDLSGDNKVDDQDHGDSYYILPVRVRVRWNSPNGPRQYELCSQLCRFERP